MLHEKGTKVLVCLKRIYKSYRKHCNMLDDNPLSPCEMRPHEGKSSDNQHNNNLCSPFDVQLETKKNKQSTRNCGPLVIIPPDDSASSSLVVDRILPALSEFLQKESTRLQLEEWSLDPTEGQGVRSIQGQRMEIYLDASSKVSTAFDRIVGEIESKHSLTDIRSHILDFAKTQARKDPRIASDHVFDNFSLLVSYDPVDAQIPHIDMVEPNYQFGLIITDNSPSTVVYEPVHKISTMEDVQQHLWKDLPMSVKNAMQKRVPQLLNAFGNVLCRDLRSFHPGYLKAGTICSMPGSVIHGGPACKEFRVVLFFSASPHGYNAPYHADTQFFAPTMCAAMVGALGESFWSKFSIEDRCYLLRKIADARRSYPALESHLTELSIEDRALKRFVQGLSVCLNETSYIHAYAARFKLLSVKGLEAEEETGKGVYNRVRVYQSGRRIYLYWIASKEWEPANDSHIITLEMKSGSRKRSSDGELVPRLFNGKNGILRDHEGDIIRCRKPKMNI